MYGDFSTVKAFRKDPNWNAVLHQQGRVLLDADWNAQSNLVLDWEDAAGAAAFGRGVLAVEAGEGDAFKVVTAGVAAGEVTLGVKPGAGWADGKRVVLVGEDAVQRGATYLDDPIPGDIGVVGTRDAVILEVYRETIHGYQRPELLIEEALGGPDTTERVRTAMRFRLVRMLEGETCDDIPARVFDDPDDRGRLTIDLEPAAVLPDPCPQIDTGGYTGLEHQMYRVEIARLGPGYPLRFKYSRFNGGLVGRGVFSAAARMLSIDDGRQAIDRAKLEDPYLEAFEYDETLGHWILVYGADVSITNSAGKIDLPTPGSTEEKFGSIPTSSEEHFFRLWDGTRLVSDFVGGPTELENGIRLDFDPSTGANYHPGDYWVFDVRAGEVSNSQTLVDDSPPHGIYHTRIPLAVLEWTGAAEITAAAEDIEDCRRPFNPLTKLGSCCRYRVGDGVRSHGDFDSIQEAVDHLPASGGEICVLPGDYEENIEVSLRHDVVIKGCGPKTRVRSKSLAPNVHKPVFAVVDSRDVRVESMTIVTDESGPGIVVDGGRAQVRSIRLEGLRILTRKRSGIEVRTGSDITIRDNFVHVSNGGSEWPAVTVRAVDSLVEHNTILGTRLTDEVVAAEPIGAPGVFDTTGDIKAYRKAVPTGDVIDSSGSYDIAANIATTSWAPLLAASAGEENVERALRYAIAREPESGMTPMVDLGTAERVNGAPVTTADGLGGLWLRGGCKRIRVIDNLIAGGGGNGITLGDIRTRIEGEGPKYWFGGFPFYLWQEEECGPEGPIIIWIPPKANPEATETQIAGEPLADIHIERNRIAAMGMNGVGVLGFFPEDEQGTITVDRLALLGNDIRGCLWRRPDSITDEMLGRIGFGGVTLATVSDLRAYDNVITGNGRSHLDPVCGIYVFHAEHADIQRNHIINNGPQSGEDIDGARRGSRAGIYLQLATSPWEGSPKDRESLLRRPLALRSAPAATIHDNTVSQPLGPAVLAVALGSISVHDNHLVSHGVEARSAATGGVVSILNLGISHDAVLTAPGAARKNLTGSFSLALTAGNQLMTADSAGAAMALTDTDLVTTNMMVGGDVEFVGNQCVLDLVDFSATEAKFAVLVATLGDLVFANNQCDALLELATRKDTVTANVFTLATTGRFLGNRMSETPATTRFSGVSMTAAANTTANNHSTHCLLILGGVPPYREGNFALADLTGRGLCGSFGRYLGSSLGIGAEVGVVERPSDDAKKGLDLMTDVVGVLDVNRAKGYSVVGSALRAESVVKDFELADVKNRYAGTDPRVLAVENAYARTKRAEEAVGYAGTKATTAVTDPPPDKFAMVGYVLDATGQPKEGATVLLRDEDGKKIPGAAENITTDSTGKYEILVDQPPEKEAFIHIRESGKRDYISRESVKLETTGKEFRDVVVAGETVTRK